MAKNGKLQKQIITSRARQYLKIIVLKNTLETIEQLWKIIFYIYINKLF